MLATGVRTGEALAVIWEEIDLDERTVAIEYTLIRVMGVGLLRESTKSEAGERTLRLPDYVLGMLRRRKLAAGGRGPLFPDSAGAGGTRRAPPVTCGRLAGGAVLVG